MNSSNNAAVEVVSFSDEKILNLCTYWGRQTLFARNKFIALLPEVNRRKLFLKKGFNSIYVFAFRLAGLSEEQVNSAIRIEKRLEEGSQVRKLFMNGAVSVSKIEKVMSVLSKENDHELAFMLENTSRKTVETYVRDIKNLPGNNNLQQKIEIVNEPPLSLEVNKKLNQLANKGIDINQIIAEALEKREQEIAHEKEKLAEKAHQKLIEQITEEKNVTRAAPAATKKLLKKEFGEKCAVPTCRNKSEEIHHTNRFSISRDHNPYYLAPLCKQHHLIAHTVDAKVMERRQFI